MNPQRTAILLSLILTIQFSGAIEESASCNTIQVCSDCIRARCSWCARPMSTNDTENRCMNKKTAQSTNWCPNHLVNLENQKLTIKDEDLTAGTNGGDTIQIKPQKITLNLNLKETITIPISYQQAKDYPIDLYYLMDLSSSMKDDKDNLSKLGSQLSDMMMNMTNNFHMGFGSFVDKPIMPYTNLAPESMKGECIKTKCEDPYGFKNRMPLTSETGTFSREVSSAPMSGNADSPEGGFDGLMQVMVCKDKIRWRENARKVIIFTTDSRSHSAGDGKLGGIIEPNDEQCHLNDDGFYTHSELMDYPSVAQLNKKAEENNMIIIFAVTKLVQDYYESLKGSIHGSSCGILEKSSTNIVKLVEDKYKEILNSIILDHDAPDHVKLQFHTACTGSEVQQTNKCSQLNGRPVVDFNISITALDCPDDKTKWTQTIHIKPRSIGEKLTIELNINCKCPCETDTKVMSPECNGKGILQCGICSCNQAGYGKNCECDGTSSESSDDASMCKRGDDPKICSGYGSCRCGTCECFKRDEPDEHIYGPYCECNDYSCQRYNNMICSGPDNGRCDCGECKCKSGWSGPACECQATNATCYAPGSDVMCSGNGVCNCGVCQCNKIDEQLDISYSGEYCTDCPHCSSNQCNLLRHCVECVVHKTGKYNNTECDEKCDASKIQTIEEFDDSVEENLDEGLKPCWVYDEGCTVAFKYLMDSNETVTRIVAQKKKTCNQKFTLITILSVVAAVVIGGVVLLTIWKISTMVHDSREYAKFINDTKHAKFGGDNPLYKPSTTTFKNPMFSK